MQHILSTGVGPDTVVFVNEFGRLGLDGKLIQREGSPCMSSITAVSAAR